MRRDCRPTASMRLSEGCDVMHDLSGVRLRHPEVRQGQGTTTGGSRMRMKLAFPMPLTPRIDSRADITPDVEPLVLGFREDAAGADDTLAPRERRVELALTATFAVAVTAIAMLFERRAVP